MNSASDQVETCNWYSKGEIATGILRRNCNWYSKEKFCCEISLWPAKGWPKNCVALSDRHWGISLMSASAVQCSVVQCSAVHIGLAREVKG